MIFKDRTAAGLRLASRLSGVSGSQSMVLGLARGGVEVAAAIAKILRIPLDVLVVKKISSPTDRELAIGALAPDGISDIDWKLAGRVGADSTYVERQITDLKHEIKLTEQLYRLPRNRLSPSKKQVILTDDGVATGASMNAAVKWLRTKEAKHITIAVPVMPETLIKHFSRVGDDLVALQTPADFVSVGRYYKNFIQVTNQRVLELLSNRKE